MKEAPVIDAPIRALASARFRSNPGYRAVPLDSLPTQDQDNLLRSAPDQELYGILQPMPGYKLPAKTICPEAALLFLSNVEAGLPLWRLINRLGNPERVLRELVLGNVLEVEHAGSFVSGPEAIFLFSRQSKTEAPQGIPQISRSALHYAQCLSIDDPVLLSAKLYAYNKAPLKPEHRERLPDTSAVKVFLGISGHGKVAETLASQWTRTQDEGAGWLSWHNTQVATAKPPKYKLYVSPVLEDLPHAFARAVETFTLHGVRDFKVGNDVFGLLRPDKLVAYFDDFHSLEVVAAELSRDLSSFRPQGVPFSAQLAGTPMLSWGMDPEGRGSTTFGGQKESWRLWVCNKLAASLLAAKAANLKDLEPWEYACERLRLDNVDTTTWTPLEGVFDAFN